MIDVLVGPGQSCMYCGQGYGQHDAYCPQREKKNRPLRYRWPLPDGQHPNGGKGRYRYGVYFSLTDLCIRDVGDCGTGKPEDVEWLD